MNPPGGGEDIFDHIPRKKKTSTPTSERLQQEPSAGDGTDNDDPQNTNVRDALDTSISHKRQSQIQAPPVRSMVSLKRRNSTGGDLELDFPQDHHSIRMVSIDPLVLRIQVSLDKKTRNIASTRRQRSYREFHDNHNDSDDLMTEEEEQAMLRKREKKRRKKETTSSDMELESEGHQMDEAAIPVHQPPLLTVEAPPPGTLSTLWYSREIYLHIFSVEKICGWKTRPKVELVVKNTTVRLQDEATRVEESAMISLNQKSLASIVPPSSDHASGVVSAAMLSPVSDHGPGVEPAVPLIKLDGKEAERLQGKLLRSREVWSGEKQRTEVSRINARSCPMVLRLAAAENPLNYEVRETQSVEEVVLIKWRGRSHLHCSWERASDVQRLDPSASNTAKAKFKKFYQGQESAFGSAWKHVLEADQKQSARRDLDEIDTGDNVEEYFSPQFLEIERVVACDENSMDMELFAKQRALNLAYEPTENEVATTRHSTLSFLDLAGRDEGAWDPEDNVRYVVKWKGLPFAEVTWEYWRDIKYAAVDEAEDFWLRQKAPSLEEAEKMANRPRPHIKDFKQIKESREYGLSKIPRPVSDLGNGYTDNNEESGAGFLLRSYQLEGVNWLLFNWWNKRSCILADEMGLG